MSDTGVASVGAQEPARLRPAGRVPLLSRRHRRWFWAYVFVLPDCIGLIVFIAIPMAIAFVVGFFEQSGFGAYSFVGLQNYQRMLHDPIFRQSAEVTLVYEVIFIPGLFLSSLGIALLLKKRRPLIGLFRSMFFAPYVVSLVVVGLVWQFLLVDKVGAVNRLLSLFHLPDVSWLGNPTFALGSVLFVSIWFFSGFYMTMFLAGLHDIPPEYYESAVIDGAGRWSTFRNVTWPLLKPTSTFVLVLAAITGIGGLQGFDLIYVMTKGGPANSTSLIIYYIYQEAFTYNDIGYAAAMASVLVAALLILMLAASLLTRGVRRGG